MGQLTAKQQMFVAEYIKDSNGTQAAIRAGYSERTAKAIGCENLTKPDIAAGIEAARKPIIEAAGLTLESHLKRLDELARKGEGLEQISAAVTAETNRGKAAGLYVTRVEDVTPDKDKLADLIYAFSRGLPVN